MRALLLLGLTVLSGHPALAQAPLVGDALVIQVSESAVAAKMKDPDSVKFRDVVVKRRSCRSGECRDDSNGVMLVCGEVNAKNGYGGYVGFEPFVADPLRKTVYLPGVLETMPLVWTDGCGGQKTDIPVD